MLINSGLLSQIDDLSDLMQNSAPPPINGSIYFPWLLRGYRHDLPNIWVFHRPFIIGFACLFSFNKTCSITPFPFNLYYFMISLISHFKAVQIFTNICCIFIFSEFRHWSADWYLQPHLQSFFFISLSISNFHEFL